MKKINKRIFLMDLIFVFNIVTFIGTGIIGIKNQTGVAIFAFSIALLNIVYLIQNVLNKIKLHKVSEHKREAEFMAEEMLDNKEDINAFKQKMLESRIKLEIKEAFPNSKIIKNAYVPRSDKNYSEIDVVAITEMGIFIIESKNINGDILGEWNQKNLIIEHPGGKKFDLPNPINQNTMHYYALKNILGLKQKYFRNIVVFGDNAYIKSFKNVPDFARICKVDRLIDSMRFLARKNKVVLAQYEIDNIYEMLLSFVEKTDEKENEHIKRIKKDIEEKND